MLELRLIGVHDDGENLVLESADGTRFLLPIDANLRTSITKARRIQPLRGRGTKGSFGPRDIQTRFRQGASVEEIAEESGWNRSACAGTSGLSWRSARTLFAPLKT